VSHAIGTYKPAGAPEPGRCARRYWSPAYRGRIVSIRPDDFRPGMIGTWWTGKLPHRRHASRMGQNAGMNLPGRACAQGELRPFGAPLPAYLRSSRGHRWLPRFGASRKAHAPVTQQNGALARLTFVHFFRWWSHRNPFDAGPQVDAVRPKKSLRIFFMLLLQPVDRHARERRCEMPQ